MKKTKPSKMQVWNHNRLLGGVSMARAAMQRVLDAETTTAVSSALAQEILTKLRQLDTTLRTRKDQQ